MGQLCQPDDSVMGITASHLSQTEAGAQSCECYRVISVKRGACGLFLEKIGEKHAGPPAVVLVLCAEVAHVFGLLDTRGSHQ